MVLFEIEAFRTATTIKDVLSSLRRKDLAEFRKAILPTPFSSAQRPKHYRLPPNRRRRGTRTLSEVCPWLQQIRTWENRSAAEVAQELE